MKLLIKVISTRNCGRSELSEKELWMELSTRSELSAQGVMEEVISKRSCGRSQLSAQGVVTFISSTFSTISIFSTF